MEKRTKILRLDWDSNQCSNGIISILEYINGHQNQIRNLYFNLLNNISKNKNNKTSLNELYSYKNGYNLWEMSTVLESSFYKTNISEIIKFLAIDIIIQHHNPSIIHLINAPARINNLLQEYCLKNKITFTRHKSKRAEFSLKNSFFFTRGLIHILKTFKINFLSFKKKQIFFSGNNSIFIASYLAHLNRKKLSDNKFGTNLWGDLPEKLNNQGKKINWLHIPTDTISPDKLFNKLGVDRKDDYATHNFITSYLNFSSWLTILIDYWRISLKSLFYKFSFEYRGVNIFPLFKKAYYSSTKGTVLAENLIFLSCFDSLFKNIPTQKIGFYLQENQGWELGFVNAWKKYNHGVLLAIQHSTVSFWDLRYKNRYYNGANSYSPDFFGVNGNPAYEHFINFDYPKNKIIKLEALRYLNKPNNNKKNVNEKTILILGDIIEKNTLNMLNIILPYTLNNDSFNYHFKSHPAQNISIDKNKYSMVKTVNSPLDKILDKYIGVICPSSSGAAVESYIYGLKTIVYVNQGDLNTSPLKDFNDAYFFSNHKEFIKNMSFNFNKKSRSDFFYGGKNLNRWKNFISEY